MERISDVLNLDARGRERVMTEFPEESKTIQSDAHRADIKFILKQYAEVGILDSLNRAEGEYLDISEFEDYADAVRQAKVAEVEFMKLPSKVREIFHHDVAEWLDTAHDPEKRDALVKAGFIEADVASLEEGSTQPVASESRPPSAEPAGEPSDGGVGAAAPPE